jgi:hypothetical protein
MKKEMLVALLAVGFVFAGVLSASAAVWTIVEDASYANNSRGADGILCTADDGSTAKCNMDNVVDCANVGNPSKGSCSFAQLTFQMASSCAAGNTGQSCTTNTDCGASITPCIACSPNPGVTYFGQHAAGGTKSRGTFTAKNCENSGDITAVSIGTSEVVTNVGGSCMTLAAANSSVGCQPGAGTESVNYDLRLWTNTIPGCNFNAGLMPGLALAGQLMPVGAPVAACGYSTGEISNIVSTAGLTGYLSVMCGSGTLPTDLATVCIAGAPWQSTIVASTAVDITATCPAACPTGCTGAAAEGVE